MALSNTARSYGSVAKALHWGTAAAFLGAYFFVYYALWVYENNKNPAFVPTLNVHWLLGLTIGFLVIPRLIWKRMNVSVEEPPGSRLEHTLAKAAHVLLYTIMIIMPLTGYLGTRHFTDLYLFQIPSFRDTALFNWMSTTYGFTWAEFEAPLDAVHHFVGKWVAWVLVLLHVAAALFHHWVRRDEVLLRMIPGTASK